MVTCVKYISTLLNFLHTHLQRKAVVGVVVDFGKWLLPILQFGYNFIICRKYMC